jgi:MFS family permease
VIKTHVEESLGANPAEAAIDPADAVAMGVPAWRAQGRARVFRALAHREYRLLFLAFAINQSGFWVSHLSLQGLTIELSHNDPLALGLVFFALFLPVFVLAPLAGVAADRLDRKRIVVACYAAVVALALSLATLTATHAIDRGSLFGLSFLLGTAFAFSGPANMAIAANSVPAADLASAVSLQSALNNLTRVLGPMLAGPLLVSGRFEIAFGAYAIAAALAGLLVARMRIAPYAPSDEALGILARIGAGFAHARERRPALLALATVAMLSLFGVSHVALLSVYAQDRLHDIAWFPWILVATGAGALLGALVSGSREATLRGSALRIVAYGALLAVFAATDRPWIALGAQALVGYCYFSVMTDLQTLIQQVVDEAQRGRVMSLFQVAWAGLLPFGSLGMGALAGALGVTPTLVFGAAVCAGCGAFVSQRARGR